MPRKKAAYVYFFFVSRRACASAGLRLRIVERRLNAVWAGVMGGLSLARPRSSSDLWSSGCPDRPSLCLLYGGRLSPISSVSDSSSRSYGESSKDLGWLPLRFSRALRSASEAAREEALDLAGSGLVPLERCEAFRECEGVCW